MSKTHRVNESHLTLAQWLERIKTLHEQSIDLGLARIKQVANIMQLRRLPSQVILIAGTNGKGTTARFLEHYLLSAGFSVGSFNSPVFFHHTEMVRINGGLLSEQQHVTALAAVWTQRGNVSLTEFEFFTLAALYMFKSRHLDYVIIEVGMGGRLDSTNVIEPDLSVITTIALDHQAFLGNSREAIGYEKAGVFRPNQVAVVGDLDIPDTVYTHAQTINCRLICAHEAYHYQSQATAWWWQGGKLRCEDLVLPAIPMQNVATGLACLQQLGLPLNSSSINQVLSELKVEGRYETVSNTPLIIADVAHNVEAASLLAQRVRHQYADLQIYAVVGLLKDKDIDRILAEMSALITHWYVCPVATPRSASVTQLTESLVRLNIDTYQCCDSVAQGLDRAVQQLPKQAMLLVFGSFFTVTAAKQHLALKIDM